MKLKKVFKTLVSVSLLCNMSYVFAETNTWLNIEIPPIGIKGGALYCQGISDQVTTLFMQSMPGHEIVDETNKKILKIHSIQRSEWCHARNKGTLLGGAKKKEPKPLKKSY